MFEWQIELIGDEKDIQFLEVYLVDTPYHVSTLGKRKSITLANFPPDADSETVHAASNKIIDIINGAAKLYFKGFGGVSFVKVLRLKENGKWIGFGYLTAPETDFTLTAYSPGDRTIFNWIDTALSNQEIERALYLFGSLELNWKNLYMVLEVIEDSFGGETSLLNTNLVPPEDVKSFKRTASSYKAIGRDARHATLKFELPREPMTLRKAQEVVGTLLQEWIKYEMRKSA